MSRSKSDEVKFDIALVSDPVGKAGVEILSNIAATLSELCASLYVITGNFPETRFAGDRVHIRNVADESGRGGNKVPGFISRQFRLALGLLRVSGKVNIVVAVGLSPVLPVLLARILRKRVVKVAAASLQQHALLEFGRASPLYHLSVAIERLIYLLSDRIVTLTPLAGLGLDRYQGKTRCAPLFIDTALFKPVKDLKQRQNIIGYIGRLEKIKGILNFVEALPAVAEERQDVKFVIIGDGTMRGKVEEGLQKSHLDKRTTLTGWVSRDKLTDYLNELKLLVLPSYSEGLPTTVLEAMACGTPVLVTPVGSVPEVVKDASTGFILPDNSPDHIARHIITALEYSELDRIASHARNIIEREYTFEVVLGRYRDMLRGLGESKGNL